MGDDKTDSGWLAIQNGGAVAHTRSDPQNRIVSIGNQAGATGMVTVSDIGSRLSTTENLLVGASGADTLNILNGGMVENDGFGLIGNLSANINSHGTVTVDDAGSTWLSNVSLLFVGDQTSLRADFVAAPGNSFRVKGPKLDRNRLRVGAGINAQLTNSIELELTYRGNIASSDKHHFMAATVRMRW